MPAIDPYAVLGLWPGATQEQIKRAYRRAVKKCHPDVNNSAGAKEDFLRVQMAYDLLSGSPFYASSDVIHGDGWSASRERTSVDFSTRSVSAYKVRMAKEAQSVHSPFFRASEKEVKVEKAQGLTWKRIIGTLWYAYLAIFAGASIGFVIEGIYFVSSGRTIEGAVAAGIGVTLIIVLVVAMSVNAVSRLFVRP